jgi:hypothetical protein
MDVWFRAILIIYRDFWPGSRFRRNLKDFVFAGHSHLQCDKPILIMLDWLAGKWIVNRSGLRVLTRWIFWNGILGYSAISKDLRYDSGDCSFKYDGILPINKFLDDKTERLLSLLIWGTKKHFQTIAISLWNDSIILNNPNRIGCLKPQLWYR